MGSFLKNGTPKNGTRVQNPISHFLIHIRNDLGGLSFKFFVCLIFICLKLDFYKGCLINLQGSDLQVEEPPPVRSPLTEKIARNSFPKSAQAYKYDGDTYVSSHILPPLKFQSALLGTHSLIAPCLDDEDDDESVASVPDEDDAEYSAEEELGSCNNGLDFLEQPILHCYGEEEIFDYGSNKCLSKGSGSSVKRGFSKETLRIEVPENFRRYTDGGLGTRKCAQRNATQSCVVSELLKGVLLCNVHVGVNVPFRKR